MSQRGPTPYLLRVLRCLRLILHFVWIAAGAVVVYPRVSYAQRTRLKQRWSHQILKILAVRLEIQPAVDAPPGSLIVANHISWLDIFAINSVRPAAFIAKSDVREWPFVGWLAERNDTIYLRRGSRGHARLVNNEIDALLNAGKDVRALKRYTRLAKSCRLCPDAADDATALAALIAHIRALQQQVGVATTLSALNIGAEQVRSALPDIVRAAQADSTLKTNPCPVTDSDIAQLVEAIL